MTTATAEKTKRYIMPRVNIVEEAERVLIEAELAGVSREDLAIEVKERELTLLGRRAHTNGKGCYLLRERAPADYRRVFALGNAIDAESITATMTNGVLTMALPKSRAYQPRTIEIQ